VSKLHRKHTRLLNADGSERVSEYEASHVAVEMLAMIDTIPDEDKEHFRAHGTPAKNGLPALPGARNLTQLKEQILAAGKKLPDPQMRGEYGPGTAMASIPSNLGNKKGELTAPVDEEIAKLPHYLVGNKEEK
jgi:hypothetical protein